MTDKNLAGQPLKPVKPTIGAVRKAIADDATALVAARNASAKPGVKWSWTFGYRGVQLTVRVAKPQV